MILDSRLDLCCWGELMSFRYCTALDLTVCSSLNAQTAKVWRCGDVDTSSAKEAAEKSGSLSLTSMRKQMTKSLGFFSRSP